MNCSRGGKLLPRFLVCSFLLPQSCRLGKPSDGKPAPPNPPQKNTLSFLGTPGEEPKMRRLLPSALRAATSHLGFPQRFCEAKDLREEEKQASKPCPDEGGAGKVCLASTSRSATKYCDADALRVYLSLLVLRISMNTSEGTSTVPILRMRFLPSFCFSRSFFLRVMSPP